MPTVHPSAIVDATARLHDDVTVGPFCTIGPHVEIGAGTRLLGHVVIFGPTRIGENNVVHPFAVLGGDPQHRDYRGETTHLEVGDDNTIREHVTIHRGTVEGGGVTHVGHNCLLMAGAHIAHDATVGDRVTLTNGTLLGGHVQLADWVVTAGHVAVAPFVRVGTSAFLAGNAMVERDVPPFVIAAGDRATVRAINRVGLTRRAVPESSRAAIKQAFHRVFAREGPRFDPHGPDAHRMAADPFVAELLGFLREPSRLGIMARHRAG
ncbi:MAG: acyl-ACP--UDP-N-acetylglucosamine O-acyltransferase [Myxococcota bacterium]